MGIETTNPISIEINEDAMSASNTKFAAANMIMPKIIARP
jgi:hypothetical protein